ncbi:selenocysteine-specific translation elongation factor [Thermovibrio sp.]
MQSKKFLVVGTAGHVDHGKTSLVKALTGIDTDRWEEEKKRGMTIDLGFAHLKLPNGTLIGIVDVPGHERFLKNMLAGAHGLDLVLFVIAADEGIMPQTKEHLTVCQSLGTKRGIVVITKKDLVEEDWLELVKEEVVSFLKGTFLEGAPVVAVSSKTGEGLKELLKEIEKVSEEVEPKSSKGILRLPVDRSFTVKGFGTVITGTLLSGKVKIGDVLELLPKGIKVKVRGIQVHGKDVNEAFAGQRTAVNLSGVKKEEVKRGDLLAPPGYLKPTSVVDVVLELSKDSEVVITSGFKVHFHHLTKEVEGEVFLIDKQELFPGEKALAQIRLKGEVVPLFKDRFVVRNYSPARVIGGGKILDPLPSRKFRKRFREDFLLKLKGLLSEDLKEVLFTHLKDKEPVSKRELVQLLGLPPEEIEEVLSELLKEGKAVVDGEYLFTKGFLLKVKGRVLELLKEHHRSVPISEGMTKEELKGKVEGAQLLSAALSELLREGKLTEEGGFFRLSGFEPREEGLYGELVKKVELVLKENPFSPPSLKELSSLLGQGEEKLNRVASYLVRRKGYHRVGDFLFSPETFEKIVFKLREHFKSKDSLSVGEFKDYFGITRKVAIPLLEYLDRLGFTQRKGNERVKGSSL